MVCQLLQAFGENFIASNIGLYSHSGNTPKTWHCQRANCWKTLLHTMTSSGALSLPTRSASRLVSIKLFSKQSFRTVFNGCLILTDQYVSQFNQGIPMVASNEKCLLMLSRVNTESLKGTDLLHSIEPVILVSDIIGSCSSAPTYNPWRRTCLQIIVSTWWFRCQGYRHSCHNKWDYYYYYYYSLLFITWDFYVSILPPGALHAWQKFPFSEEDNILSEEDVRYWGSDVAASDMESLVLQQPNDIHMWLKLAYKKMYDSNRSVLWVQAFVGNYGTHRAISTGFCSRSKDSVDHGLNVLARGLEANPSSSHLWMHYLSLLSKRKQSSDDLIEMYKTALHHAASYALHWEVRGFNHPLL